MTARYLVQAVAYAAKDPMFRFRRNVYYLERVNLALRRVVMDTHALLINSTRPFIGVTGQRNFSIFNMIAASSYQFLAIHKIWIDGYEVRPLKNGFHAMNMVNLSEGNIIRGYHFVPGPGLLGNEIWLDPVPANGIMFSANIIYVAAPVALSLDTNSTCALGDEYQPAVEALALALCFPPGSGPYMQAFAAYKEWLNDALYDEERRSEELDTP